jgi:6-pyruvoyltetrahydropterin/6-carboxytetrahydropterin synthase
MGTIYLHRRVSFAAGHAYWLADRTEAENHCLFGRFASRWGHGHNYVVEATVAGEVDPVTGMVVNIRDVDRVLQEQVVAPLADRHLTYEVPHFRDTPPTLENLARFVADRFVSHFSSDAARLTRVTVWESPTLWVTLPALDECHTNTAMPTMLLTRSLDFAAAHRLDAPSLSAAENLALFGKCNNPRGHGHNYAVEVTVRGEPDPLTGMLVDLDALDAVLEHEVMARYDHKHLNEDVADFATVNPTSENLTLAIWSHLDGKIPAPACLYRIVVRETDRNYFEYYGEASLGPAVA